MRLFTLLRFFSGRLNDILSAVNKLAGAVMANLALAQENKMTQQEILDKIAGLETKEDAVLAVLGEVKTDVDALKVLVANGDLQAVSDKLDELGGKVDAVSAAAADVKTDATPQ